ncbi:MAG TPA: GYD domain-containing protein [Candidatus Dormibacteraeota bacterium]|nr:GYD domain-containing protein [Candidatus Dormibacteraeota bacterium]HEX2679908.1 GYD domain-containing protein [Candidatus Dormibacteraeota bacterium]
MPRYLFTGSYTVEGLKGVLKEGGTGRKKAVEAAVKAMGGHLEAYYFAFGDDDVVAIADVPDNVTALALSMGIAATGTVRVKTTVLLTPEEVDAATKKTLSFRAAGQ